MFCLIKWNEDLCCDEYVMDENTTTVIRENAHWFRSEESTFNWDLTEWNRIDTVELFGGDDLDEGINQLIGMKKKNLEIF